MSAVLKKEVDGGLNLIDRKGQSNYYIDGVLLDHRVRTSASTSVKNNAMRYMMALEEALRKCDVFKETGSIKAAKAKVKKSLGLVTLGRHKKPVKKAAKYKPKTFSDMCRLYLSKRPGDVQFGKTQIDYIRRFESMFGELECSEVNHTLIYEYYDDRMAEVSGATVKRELGCLLPIIKTGERRGWIDPMPHIERPAEGEARLRYLSPDEIRSGMAVCATKYAKHGYPDHLPIHAQGWWGEYAAAWQLASFLMDTGARIGEAMQLTWDDVSLKEGKEISSVTLTTRKRRGGYRARRVVPLTDRGGNALRNFGETEKDRTGLVFTRWGGNLNSRKKNAGAAIVRCAEEGGIVDFVPHDLRRTFATTLLELNANPRTVADLLGHTKLDMVMRYMQVPRSTADEAVELVQTRWENQHSTSVIDASHKCVSGHGKRSMKNLEKHERCLICGEACYGSCEALSAETSSKGANTPSDAS